jgi:hypothetical protein
LYAFQIAAEGRERYQNTLVGRLAEYMRDVGEPVSLLQCTEALRDVFPELKKPDGTRYKGSLERAIHGALWSTGVFRKNEVCRLCSPLHSPARSSEVPLVSMFSPG